MAFTTLIPSSRELLRARPSRAQKLAAKRIAWEWRYGHFAQAALAMLILMLTADRIAAHGILADCRLKGGRLVIEVYFDDDKPADKARVKVLDAQKRIIAEGRADDKGLWSFPRPAAGTYEIIVDHTGHRKLVTITIPADSTSAPLSSEPSRAEATRFPWERLGLGLLAIAAASAIFLLRRRVRWA